ncbi:MAG TPA: LacI family transcriptional regulator [Chloroflexi bacterium]|nr:LacI family transcriptional regulator [Chloroflexota bacterium]HBY06551.1 LacI family transcriptional regulator [Chloroflexota bacterium]
MPDYTLEDIAKLAGVSRATVSRVVNEHPNVSEKMRLRVQEVIQETGYQPNLMARSLVSQRTKLIGLVIPRGVHGFFTDPYFPKLIEGISQACNQYGYTLTLSLFFSDKDERELLPRVTQKGLLDGIIVQATGLGNQSSIISQWGVPFIFAGRPMGISDVSYVDVDNRAGAYSAIAHLAHLGYNKIATVTGALNTTVGADRLEGYRQAIQERNLELDENLIAEADFTEFGAYFAAKKLLKQSPEAIFVASDTMALGVIKAIKEEGLLIPDDIALVGFDDLLSAAFLGTQLTTVRQPIGKFGFKAVEMLLDIIENGPQPPRRVIFDTELVIRESCGSPFPYGN